jgi:hypothetical protein
MNTENKTHLLDLEPYRLTAQAIGLIELFGNMQPNNGQVRTAERLVHILGLSWEACENQPALLHALKNSQDAFSNH